MPGVGSPGGAQHYGVGRTEGDLCLSWQVSGQSRGCTLRLLARRLCSEILLLLLDVIALAKGDRGIVIMYTFFSGEVR